MTDATPDDMAAELHVRDWSDISTAPKDGTDIIVFRPGCKPNAYIPQVGTDYFKRDKWMHSNGATQPTHWMPLPDPPTKGVS